MVTFINANVSVRCMNTIDSPEKISYTSKLPDYHMPDICYKQWCISMNKGIGLMDHPLSDMHWFQRDLSRRLNKATQHLIDDFKALDPNSCAYLARNFGRVMRNLSNVRQHADAELEELLSEFKGLVHEAYEMYSGASVEDIVSSYDIRGSSLVMQ